MDSGSGMRVYLAYLLQREKLREDVREHVEGRLLTYAVRRG